MENDKILSCAVLGLVLVMLSIFTAASYVMFMMFMQGVYDYESLSKLIEVDLFLILSPFLLLATTLLVRNLINFNKAILLALFLSLGFASFHTVNNNGYFTRMNNSYLFDFEYFEVEGFSNKLEYLKAKKNKFQEEKIIEQQESKAEMLKLQAKQETERKAKEEAELKAKLWKEGREERIENKVNFLIEELRKERLRNQSNELMTSIKTFSSDNDKMFNQAIKDIEQARKDKEVINEKN